LLLLLLLLLLVIHSINQLVKKRGHVRRPEDLLLCGREHGRVLG